MRALPQQDVLNLEAPVGEIEHKRALMDHRLRQARIAAMTASIAEPFTVLLKREMFRIGLLEQAKNPFGIEFVLLDFIDHDGVVVAGSAKQVPRGKVGGIDETAGIDHDRHAGMVIFEAEKLVVFVVAKSARTRQPLVTAR